MEMDKWTDGQMDIVQTIKITTLSKNLKIILDAKICIFDPFTIFRQSASIGQFSTPNGRKDSLDYCEVI